MEKSLKKETKKPKTPPRVSKNSLVSTKKTLKNLKTEKQKQKKEKESSPLRITSKIFLLVLWIVSVLIIFNILWSILFALFFTKEEIRSPLISSLFGIIYYISSLLAIIYLPQKLFRRHTFLKTTKQNLGLIGLPTFSDIGLAPVAFFAYLIPAYLLSMFFELIPGFNATEEQDLGIALTPNSPKPEKLIVFIILCILTPIVEELIFRGWFYEKLRKIIPKKYSVILSILIVSAVFGLIHGQWNVAVNVFALSVISCLLREITGTIYSSIFLHVIKNTIAFLFVYVLNIS